MYPPSPPAEPEASLAPFKPSLTPEPLNMASMPTPSTVNSTSPNQRLTAVRRDRSPPRSASGDIVCDHPECRDIDPLPTFRRPCEWNKHMDRHERPYKCHEPGCEVTQGFTYSGGLLRHQREVHKMHLSSKEPLFCPFPNCIRATGSGFTRKENLEEHKRRRHYDEMPQEEHSPSNQVSRKRKRPMTPQPEVAGNQDSREQDVENDDEEEVMRHPYVRRLRAQLAEKDHYLRLHAMEINRLTSLIRALPPQAIYGVNTNLMSPPTSTRNAPMV